MNDTKSKVQNTPKILPIGAGITHMYADTPVELGIGPFVSRVTFGNQGSDGDIVPQFQLVMPSNALLSFAQLIVSTFNAESGSGRLQDAHQVFISEISGKPQIAGSRKEAKKA